MEYLKTYNEAVDDFYLQDRVVTIIVDEDEKWVLSAKPEGGSWSDSCATQLNFRRGNNVLDFQQNWLQVPHLETHAIFISPIENIGNWFSEFMHNSRWAAKQYLLAIERNKMKFPHGYYIKDNDSEIDSVISLTKKYPEGINPIFVTQEQLPNQSTIDKTDGIQEYPKVETELKDHLLGGHPVIGMKFKIIDFQMGFQKFGSDYNL